MDKHVPPYKMSISTKEIKMQAYVGVEDFESPHLKELAEYTKQGIN